MEQAVAERVVAAAQGSEIGAALRPAIERVDGEWRISGSRSSGRVVFSGTPAFTARFTDLANYAFDEASQELAINDPERGRIFHDFEWARQEPSGKQLDELAKSLRRKVQAAIAGR